MSFGGGDSPQNTQFQTTYQREAPQVEAAKLGLMQTAQDYTRFGIVDILRMVEPCISVPYPGIHVV